MLQKPTITLIGAGNMGSSLMGGLIADGYPASKIWAACPERESLDRLSQKWGIQTTLDNHIAAKAADVWVLAIKPQIMPNVTNDLATIAQTKRPLVISIAAGIPISALQHWLGNAIAIVRCMPNTLALVSCGATAMFANSFVTAEQRELAESILRAVGITVWLNQENDIDIVTALSGSGPAYFLLVMEALEQSAIELGLPAETAKILTLQTALGAARLALESDEDTVELRRRVTSPGGTTEAALNVLETGKLRELFAKALLTAKERSIELAKAFGNHA